ncbi:MAG: hypothetical protein HKO66_02545 [Saprospiraceae bacterium]|nr:hypothetical protein [Bacteroidia bacterium]NNE14001.1 hypothetical protein [Saprospiraceae bacterium]NNL91092.1 hypothetical protein [Saprospiraceae bacterium]
MKNLFYIAIVFCISFHLNGQDKVHQTFKDTRVINTHSVETLRKGILDFRISHRFGDAAGAAGGWPTFYGLESASDVLIGLEYGLSDNFMVGISRTKGAGPLRQNINGLFKYRVMRQDDGGGTNPFSVAFVGNISYSTMQFSNLIQKKVHRFSYNLQALFGSRLSENIAMQVGAAWTYRNNVFSDDTNDLPSVSAVFKYQFSKVFALILDANFPFSEIRNVQNGYYNPIGVGFEWETGGGHVFQINLTNARGLIETDYIPYTRSNWGDGEYRIGFTISRGFKL